LAVLEAVRRLDQQGPEGIEDYRKLGASSTVSAQIQRYRELVRVGGTIEASEVAQLFRLVGRRPDASLVFCDAGRGAAREALRRTPRRVRLLRGFVPGAARRRLGIFAASRIAASVFGVVLSAHAERGLVAAGQTPSVIVDSEGVGCVFFGAALAEVLRSHIDFDGAMLHDSCRARGDEACTWYTGNKTRW
jgi:hypothetical protein